VAAEFCVRPAHLEDAAEITALHRSTVEGAAAPAASLLERWRQGGPWMAVESCAVHLNHLLRTPGRYVFVAEQAGRVVGELEAYLSHEAAPFGGLHLALLYVHRDHQQQGIGSALMGRLVALAVELGLPQITTQPEPEAESFYRRHGFRPWLTLWEMQAEAKGRWRQRLRALPAWEEPPSRLALRIGRYQCGPQEWENLFPPLCLPGWSDLPRRIWKTHLRGVPVVLALRRQLNDRSQADGFAWLPPELPLEPAIEALQALAAEEGYAAVDLLLPQAEARRGQREGRLAFQTNLQLWRRPVGVEQA